MAAVYKSINQTVSQKHLKQLNGVRNVFEHACCIAEYGNLQVPEFKVASARYHFSTRGEIDFIDLTDKIHAAVAKSGIKNGVVHVFAPHATGILLLTENDYALLEDTKALLEQIAPKNKQYMHPSNAHAHLRSALLPPDRTLPVIDGQVEFGTWQSLFFVETDVYPRNRTVIVQVMGEQ